jgi:hypothetical protein
MLTRETHPHLAHLMREEKPRARGPGWRPEDYPERAYGQLRRLAKRGRYFVLDKFGDGSHFQIQLKHKLVCEGSFEKCREFLKDYRSGLPSSMIPK